MKVLTKLVLSLILVLTLGFIYCSSDDDDNNTKFNGNAIKGPVMNANVEVFILNPDGTTGSQVGKGKTDSKGAFQIELSSNYSDKMLLLVITNGSYIDEASGKEIKMGPNEYMEVIFNPKSQGVVVTPLTTIASKRIKKEGTENSKEVYDDVAAEFNMVDQETGEIIDITTTTPNDLTDGTSDSPSSNETRYAFVLAGITEYANKTGVTALEITEKLATDYADNSNFTDVGKEILNGIEEGIKTFANSDRNKSGIADPGITLGDLTPPIVRSLNINQTSYKPSDTLSIDIDIFDPGIGLGWFAVYVQSPDGKVLRVNNFKYQSGANPYVFKADIPVLDYFSPGKWTIKQISVCDAFSNCNIYDIDAESTSEFYQYVKSQSQYKKSESNIKIINFDIQNSTSDNDAPEITGFTALNTAAKAGDTMEIEAKTNFTSGANVVNLFAWFKSPSGGFIYVKGMMKDGKLVLPFAIDKSYENGKWQIFEIFLLDAAMNKREYFWGAEGTYYQDKDTNGTVTNLEKYSFDLNVVDTTPDTEFPVIKELKVDPTTVNINDTVTLSIKLDTPTLEGYMGIDHIIFRITSINNDQNFHFTFNGDDKIDEFNATTGAIEMKTIFNSQFEEGEWILDLVKIRDDAGHETTYAIDKKVSTDKFVIGQTKVIFPHDYMIDDIVNNQTEASMYNYYSDVKEYAVSEISIPHFTKN